MRPTSLRASVSYNASSASVTSPFAPAMVSEVPARTRRLRISSGPILPGAKRGPLPAFIMHEFTKRLAPQGGEDLRLGEAFDRGIRFGGGVAEGDGYLRLHARGDAERRAGLGLVVQAG